MKKQISYGLATLLLAVSSVTLNGATAEQLIQAHLKAIGGVEAHKKLTSRVMKGTLDMPGQGIKAEITIRAKAPNKLRTEIEIPGLGKMVEGFDGKVAWQENPFTGAGIKPDDQQAQSRRQADFYRDVELLSRFESWALKGKETVRGRSAHVLEGRSTDGGIETLYLDEATLMLVQVKSDFEGVKATVQLSDHREVNGIKVPFAIEMDVAAMGAFSIRVTEVQHGVEMEDKIFRLGGVQGSE